MSSLIPSPRFGRPLWSWAARLALALFVWVLATGFTPVSQHGPASAAAAGSGAAPLRYVDNKACLGCHAEQARDWKDSRHAHAMAPASRESILAPFAGERLVHEGVSTRFFRQGPRFLVETEGPDGRKGTFEVAYAFGVEPLQQYLIQQPGGRWQAFQLAWDVHNKRWFPLRPELGRLPPADALHWTGRYQTANTMCIACHTTGYEKRYDLVKDVFKTRWNDSNVSCQACHGPGSAHVEWARSGNKSTANHRGWPLGLLAGRSQVESCANCHSRRADLTDLAEPKLPRLDHQVPSLLTEGLYHADGQQLDEVFEDGSFRQSSMYRAGVSCTDCHSAHSGKLKLQGNAVCLQCHAPAPGNARFPAAAGQYDTPAHHFHKPGSAGSQCVSCHMPAKTYMRLQARLDHALRVPRPDLSVALGTPNACTQCHTDKADRWAADWAQRWWGPPKPTAHARMAHALAAARSARPGADLALADLARDLAQPDIVRATAAHELRRWPHRAAQVLGGLAGDTSAEVRAAAAASLEAAPAEVQLQWLPSLLNDPSRAVRIAAARSLTALPPSRVPREHHAAWQAALREYESAQVVHADLPGARQNLAVLRELQSRPGEAELHYRAALRFDAQYEPARLNLAALLAAGGRSREAEPLLREGIALLPRSGALHYSLGLLLAEQPARLQDAAASLSRAAQLMPEHPRVHANLGLAWAQLGDRARARTAIQKHLDLQPGDAEFRRFLEQLQRQP